MRVVDFSCHKEGGRIRVQSSRGFDHELRIHAEVPGVSSPYGGDCTGAILLCFGDRPDAMSGAGIGRI
jgi:hypothetical protein